MNCIPDVGIDMEWDRCYHDGHTPWDKGAAAPPLIEWLSANPDRIEGRVLVPGCGLGHDVRAIAESTGADPVVGIDIAPRAVEGAVERSASPGERYEVLDLFDLPHSHRGTYAWVWEHTCYCAIEPDRRDEYVEAVHGALADGGRLLGVFFLDPYDEEHHPGEGPPHGCSVSELHERFVKSGRFRVVESYVPGRTYEGREGLEQIVLMEKPPVA